MRRFLLIAVPVFVLGFVAGNAFWYLASPLWIDVVVNEELPAELQLTPVASGSFADADAVHRGTGTATILESTGGTRLLRLADFEVTNGPDLKVYLVGAASIGSSADVKAAPFLSLGPLKGNIGDQTYVVPDGTDPTLLQSAVIWCEQFGVLFSSAPLVPNG